MAETIPINESLEMLKKGMSNEEITRSLEGKGYNLQQISDAINQAKIKEGVAGSKMPQDNLTGKNVEEELNIPPAPGSAPPSPETPGNETPIAPPGMSAPGSAPQRESSVQAPSAPQYQMPAQPAMGIEDMQAVIEQIVEEKWKEMMGKVGDLSLFKSRVGDDMESVKQELLRTQKRLEDLQVAVLGKVKEYNQGVQSISTDMKALEQVFSKIIGPLTSNIKELGRITEDLKKDKPKNLK